VNLAAIKPGRPRDASRDAVILEATLAVLKSVGYDRLTIDAVASRARASKATVYRRWPNKAALVVDAMASLKPPTVDDEPACLFPDTGSLRGDLMSGLRAIFRQLNTDEGKLMIAIMTAQAHDPELAAAMRANTKEKEDSCRIVVGRAIQRGELVSEKGVNAFVEVLPALLYNKLLITGGTVDDDYLAHLIDDIALPLLTRD